MSILAPCALKGTGMAFSWLFMAWPGCLGYLLALPMLALCIAVTFVLTYILGTKGNNSMRTRAARDMIHDISDY
jgi:hypothetical protein